MGHFGHLGVNIAVAAEVVKWFNNVIGTFGVKALSVALLR